MFPTAKPKRLRTYILIGTGIALYMFAMLWLAEQRFKEYDMEHREEISTE